MLIEFSVSNFRSFRERQTLSMVAAPRLRKSGCLIRPKVAGERIPPLLKVAAIYGPNASGKSNLLQALAIVPRLTRRQPSGEFKPLPVSPFRFDKDLTNEPSYFELHFISGGLRFQYEVGATALRITEERLIAYPKGRPSVLFSRKHVDGVDQYEFGELEGESELHNAWKRLTGPQMLFLSQAVANSNEELRQLRNPFNWLQSDFLISDDDHLQEFTKLVQATGVKLPIGKKIAAFLQDIDVPVTKIVFENLTSDSRSPDEAPNPMLELEELTDHLASTMNQKHKTTLTHTTDLGDADFDLLEESKGTRNLMGFYVPWMSMESRTVVIDEFDSSLHPLIVATLIQRYVEKPETGQLIFTTHDTHLMDSKILRRDQIWLTERDSNGATLLRSIHEFKGREGEDIEKRYFEGRYRSLPIVSRI